MNVVLSLAVALLQAASHDAFIDRANLQALYDEISQITVDLKTDGDIDQFHEVFHTPDWEFVDMGGQHHPWADMRAQMIRALPTPTYDSMTSSTQKVSFDAQGATVLVHVSTVRTIVDQDGQYGAKGRSHTLTEVTPFRDTWVRMSDDWRMKTREQLGKPNVFVDKPLPDEG